MNSAGQPHYFGTDPSRDCIDRAEASCALPNSLPRSAEHVRGLDPPLELGAAATTTTRLTTPSGDGSYTWGPAATDPYWSGWAARVSLVQGQFTGTTTEMFSWAACRWGIEENLLRAVAVIESTWHQSTWGDRCGGGDPTIGSFSVMQIKNKNCDGSLLWGGMPDVQDSTALAVDLYAARLRACYNGDFYDGGSWLYHGKTVRQIAAGNGWPYVLWGCVGSWYLGRLVRRGRRELHRPRPDRARPADLAGLLRPHPLLRLDRLMFYLDYRPGKNSLKLNDSRDRARPWTEDVRQIIETAEQAGSIRVVRAGGPRRDARAERARGRGAPPRVRAARHRHRR